MLDDTIRFVHLIAASVWVGGLITLAALVAAVRRTGADRSVLQAMARQFGRLSWTAIAVAVTTGVIQLARSDVSLSSDTDYAVTLFVKLTLVGLAVGLAIAHQITANRSSPAARGAIQGLILLSSLGIVAAAVTL
jgi:putative copper export protein